MNSEQWRVYVDAPHFGYSIYQGKYKFLHDRQGVTVTFASYGEAKKKAEELNNWERKVELDALDAYEVTVIVQVLAESGQHAQQRVDDAIVRAWEDDEEADPLDLSTVIQSWRFLETNE